MYNKAIKKEIIPDPERFNLTHLNAKLYMTLEQSLYDKVLKRDALDSRDYLILTKCMQYDLKKFTDDKAELNLTDSDITFILFSRALMVTRYKLPSL